MTRSSTSWLVLERAAGDLEGQIHRAIRDHILERRLASGQKLPSSRALSAGLGVARSTVVGAYERLLAEGFLIAAAGSATRVASLPQPPRAAASSPRQSAILSSGLFEPSRDLHPGIPDLSEFPDAVWARCLAARARALRIHDLGYGAPAGLPELRSAILAHVTETRGVLASADQVVILPSAAAAIALVARLVSDLAGPGEPTCWIEDPGYPKAQALLRDAGWRLVAVACDGGGLDVANGRGPRPRLIYVTPSHQYPSGATLSLSRRLALLRLAQSEGAIVVEDDYDSEFRYGSRPIAALQGIDRSGSVAYIGTFSKVLAPGLRVAYAILPPPLLGPAIKDFALRGSTTPVHVQAALADFIREGRLRAHIRRMTPLYAARMAATAEILRRDCDDLLRVGEADGGLQLAAWFRDENIDDRAVASALRHQNFGIQALSDFYLGPARPGLLFGIATAVPERVRAAAALIRKLVAEPARRQA